MATVLGLNIKFAANTAGISKGAKQTAKQLAGIQKSASQATSALRGLVAIEIGKMFTSAVTSISGFVDNVRQSVGELTKLAQVSNTSVERFQGLAVAAKSVGIEQDKLADIFKDVGDRVGDFLQTGGGPMADFFENIAPLVGVTAEQFAQLSGPEALQLYVDSLQKAGLSQAEMTFYLEAMSSDLTALLPLLQDGGKGFEELAARAERLGLVMSEDQTQAIKDMNASLGLVYATFEGIIGQVTANLAPTITAIAEEFLQFVEGYKGLGEGTGGTALADSITNALFDGAEYLADLLDSAVAQLNDWGVNVESTFSGLESTFQFFVDAVTFLNDAFYFVRSTFNDFLASFAEVSSKFVAYFSSAGAEFLDAFAENLRASAAQDRERTSGPERAAPQQQGEGMFGGAVRRGRKARESARSPEAQAAREQKRREQQEARDAAQKERERLKKEEQRRKEEQKMIDDYNKQVLVAESKALEASLKYEQQRVDGLAAVNQKALEASDIRSGGIGQVLAMATGREDPAVTEARKQLKELQAMRAELAALKAMPVEIMGAA